MSHYQKTRAQNKHTKSRKIEQSESTTQPHQTQQNRATEKTKSKPQASKERVQIQPMIKTTERRVYSKETSKTHKGVTEIMPENTKAARKMKNSGTNQTPNTSRKTRWRRKSKTHTVSSPDCCWKSPNPSEKSRSQRRTKPQTQVAKNEG